MQNINMFYEIKAKEEAYELILEHYSCQKSTKEERLGNYQHKQSYKNVFYTLMYISFPIVMLMLFFESSNVHECNQNI